MEVKLNQNFVFEKNISPDTSDKKISDSTETNDLMKTLQKNFSVVKNGAAAISKKYLRECLTDEGKQEKLFNNLQAAEEIYKNADKNQNVRVKIDGEGEMTVESSKTTVTFNEAKRARQLAAAKTSGDVEKILSLLEEDLSECEEGLKNNWCDEEEVKKVKAMIERAKELLNKVEKNPAPKDKNFSAVDILI